VQRRIDLVMGRRYRHGARRGGRDPDGERYLQLLEKARGARAHARRSPTGARDRAEDVLPPLVARAWKRLDREMRQAERAEPGEPQDFLLHESRKLAKATRYARESVVPVFGKKAKALRRRDGGACRRSSASTRTAS
jgi:CHAD domain-containing protein